MTTYYVGLKGSTGLNGSDSHTTTQAQDPTTPWLTFNKAAEASAAGDTIKIMPGTYNRSSDTIDIRKNSQVWTAYDQNDRPVIDGNYGPDKFRLSAGGKLELPHPRKPAAGVTWRPDPGVKGYISGGLVKVRKDVTGVTVSYLKIVNSAGAAISIGLGCANTTIDNCICDFTYSGTIGASGNQSTRLQDFTVSNCTITRSSLRFFAEGKTRFCEGHQDNGAVCPGGINDHIGGIDPSGGSESVDVAIKPKYSDGSVVSGNMVAFTYGEGIAAAAGVDDMLIEDNVVHDTNHWGISVNCATNVTVRRNQVYCDGTLANIDIGSGGIVLGDEKKLFQDTDVNSANISIYNNISVGYRYGFEIRGVSGNYATWLSNTYIGYNTFMAGRKVLSTKPTTAVKLKDGQTEAGAPRPHRGVLFENNVCLKGPADSIAESNGTLANCYFRNNAFSETEAVVTAAVAKLAAGAGNVYGSTVAERMTNANAQRSAAGYDVEMTNAEMATLLTTLASSATAFKATNYHQTGGAVGTRSPVIGAGSVHTAFGGSQAGVDLITPAVGDGAGQDATDYLEAARSDEGGGKYYDIGFYELGGTTNLVTPSFTQTDPTSGDPIPSAQDMTAAGVPVRFTDTSTTSGGATILERRWDIDGPSGTTEPVTGNGTTFDFTYSTPGTYTPSMSIRTSENNNTKWYSQAGTAMTFRGGGSTGVLIDSISTGIGTGLAGSTKAYTFSLGDAVPKLVVFTMTAAIHSSDVADHALLSHGFASFNDGVISQFAASMYSKDGEAATRTGRRQVNTHCLIAVNETGAVTGSARIVAGGFTKNTVTLTIDEPFDANYLVTATAYGGSGISAMVGSGIGPAVNGGTVDIAAGFEPQLLCVLTNNVDLNVGRTTAALSFGYATSVANQYYVRWHEGYDKDTALPQVDGGFGMAYRNQGDTQMILKLTALSPTGATLTAEGGDYYAGFGWYAIRSTKRIDMQLLKVPVITNPITNPTYQDVTIGWEPGHMQSVLTMLDMPATPSTWRASVLTKYASHIGLHVNKEAGTAYERTNLPGIRHGDGTGVTNTTSRILNNVMGLRTSFTNGTTDDITTDLAAAASFLSTGYRIAWTTNTISNRAWLVIVMETGDGEAPSGPPLVSFSVTPTSGTAPLLVKLTDTSSGNGDTIDSWDIEWGDGAVDSGLTSRPTNKEHTYTESGTYNIKVSATNTSGTASVTRNGAVVVTGDLPDQIVGPLRPGTITENTDNVVDLDPDSATRGVFTSKLDLGAVKFSRDYENGGTREWVADSGKWQIAVIGNTLKVMTAGGRIGTFDITWETEPPSGDSGTVNAKVSTGGDDGDQDGTGAVTLNAATTLVLTAGTQWAAVRFRNITIPQAASIQTATLKVYVNDASKSSPNFVIYANKVANAAVLSEANNSISGLARTTASVTWNASSIGSGWKDAPSIKTVIQEVVNQFDWANGNALTLIFDGVSGTNFQFRPYEYNSTLAAELVITWTK